MNFAETYIFFIEAASLAISGYVSLCSLSSVDVSTFCLFMISLYVLFCTYHFICGLPQNHFRTIQGHKQQRPHWHRVSEQPASVDLTADYKACCYKAHHDSQWCIAKNGGGYTQRGMAKGLKVPCLFMITEVSIRCQKNPGGWYMAYTRVYPPIHH